MAGQKDGRGGPRNRTGRTHDPYSTPLRDANRDRLYGFLTARAAWTLLTYLVEINKAGASFLTEYMSVTPSRTTTARRRRSRTSRVRRSFWV